MCKIYKIVRGWYGKKAEPVYYENIVDLVDVLALAYYRVFVDGSVELLESIKSLCLIRHPEDFRLTRFYPHDMFDGFDSIILTCTVSEVEVDQDGHLLSTPS